MTAQAAPGTQRLALALPPAAAGRRAWARRASRNRMALAGAAIVAILVLLALSAPWITPARYDRPDFGDAWQFPSPRHWMGTDGVGRDLYSRVVYGSRVSLLVGLTAQTIALGVGLPLGLSAGVLGGRVDFAVMRVVDALTAFPQLLFALLIMVVLGSGLGNILLAIGLHAWIPICRLVRAQSLREREQEYAEAARAQGAGRVRIVLRHILPNLLAPVIVAVTLGIPQAIFTEAALSFLGIGIKPPAPSWGQMVGEGVNHIRFYWHLALFPAVMIAFTMAGFVLLGDGLRDVLDPRASM
ncbi:MAG: ABC transporter permease [Bacillati bacterium ANGP1]|uniref:ABC transporter permease n=1 Tax=Candidatus Segetimicrobium genomatis TaxID=2569760 RepID=A0A537JJM5_9BACT|nr:MAG: ABC transporter permease [Terrabacteria group bacterium ANGP1]